jgi:hypothetical protein
MKTKLNPYRSFRFPAEIIRYAAQLYPCFSLNLRRDQADPDPARHRRQP